MKSWKSIVVGALLAACLTASGAERGRFKRSLSADAKEALIAALAGPDGEYAAHAQYSAIIDKFGEVQPYVTIRMAESRHIAALERQFEKYGIKVPANKFEGAAKAPKSLTDAATEAIASEEKNVALNDDALKKVEQYPDLTRVFSNLRTASKEAHLPAFKTAAEKGGNLDSSMAGCCRAGCMGETGCCMQDDPTPRRRRGWR